jgi:tetratricopeptide (TPR) repeat protein
MICKRIFTALSTALLLLNFATMAQKGVEDGSKFGKGQDSIRAMQNLSMYQQYVKQNAYKEAHSSWRVIYNEAPRASFNMYLHGVVIYKTLMNETKDPVLRRAYVDTIMMIYDQRSKYFGKRGEVLARKAVELRELDETRIAEAYDFITEGIKLDGHNIPDFAINTYMQISLSRYLKNEIDRDAMVNNFATSIDIMEHKLKAATEEKNRESYKQIIDNVQLIFSNSGAASCETLVPVLSRKYDKNPDDLETINGVLNLLRTVRCEDSELFAKVAEKLHSKEPSANSAYNLGKYFLARKDFAKTIPYYEQALSLEQDDQNKAKYYSELALIYLATDKSPVETRAMANNALRLNPNDGRSLLIIGRLYAQYNKNISDKEFEQNTAFWAAVDKFIQAKRVDSSVAEEADRLIATYSVYFPTQETAFFNDLSEGQDWRVPGWINENTKVRIRK